MKYRSGELGALFELGLEAGVLPPLPLSPRTPGFRKHITKPFLQGDAKKKKETFPVSRRIHVS